VWCVSALSDGHAAGHRLRTLLHGDLQVVPLAVEAAEPPAERAAYARGAELAEQAVGSRVAPGDVVVLHDWFTASFAAALRERGAHAVWHLRSRSGAPSARPTTDFLDRGGAAALDAVVIDQRRGLDGEERVAALIPAARLLDVRQASAGGDAARTERLALAWASLLGDIVEEDRSDHVGGLIRARPAVAPR
jgi:hypothetical protein